MTQRKKNLAEGFTENAYNNTVRPIPVVGVIGPSQPTPAWEEMAYRVGKAIAQRGWVLLTGGYGGIMEAASRGAQEAGGLVMGMLMGTHPFEGNPYLTIALPTGLSHVRNALVVQTSWALVAIGWSLGTLNELSLALRIGKPVIGLFQPSWPFPLPQARHVDEVVSFLQQTIDKILQESPSPPP